MIRIGLTGGIAAGKSTVATHLRELDATLVDYDVLARKVVEPGSVGLQRIVEHFGPDAMNAQGGLNRRWMSEHVFSDPNAESERRILDDIEHPLIYDLALSEERQAVEKNPDAVVVHDIPLLAEVIDDIPMRVERMMRTRGMSEAQAKARIAHQPTRAARESIADAVIDSSQDVEHMFDCVDRLMEQWRKEARRNHGIQH